MTTARKRPIQPSTRDEQTLAEGRHVFDRASARFAAFQALDAGNKVKLFPRARLTALGTLVREVSTAMTAHALGTDEALGGTAREAALREALVERVRAVRDRIAAAYPDQRELARACGVGKRLSPKSNQDAMAMSAEQQQAFEHASYGPKMRAAGVRRDAIDAVVEARRALAAAGTTQTTRRTAKVGKALSKKQLLRELRAEIVHVRRVAKIAFRGDAAILAEFAPPARAPLRRTKKGADATKKPADTAVKAADAAIKPADVVIKAADATIRAADVAIEAADAAITPADSASKTADAAEAPAAVAE